MQMIVPRNLNLHLEFLYDLPLVLRPGRRRRGRQTH